MDKDGTQSYSTSVGRLVVSLIIVAFAVFLFIKHQAVIDNINVWSYQPTSGVSAIAKADTMTDKGKFYFYASRPRIENRDQFNESCKSVGDEKSAVLGCYASQRIYVFNVTDKQLNGIKQVTAAHEMLHAAYDRLDSGTKAQVDSWIEAEAKSSQDKTIESLLKIYAKTEPGERLNELHSIFGSQVGGLNPELENYYKRYFEDRSKVVDLYQQYHSVFDNIKTKQDQLVSQLKKQASQIKSLKVEYLKDVNQLNYDFTDYGAEAANGQLSQSQNQSQFDSLKQRQSKLATSASKINTLVRQYNAKRQQLITVDAQATQLNSSMNSSLQPIKGIE